MNTYFVDAHRPENEHLVAQVLAETRDLWDGLFISPRADKEGLVTVGVMSADEAAAYAANGGQWGYQRLGDWRAEARQQYSGGLEMNNALAQGREPHRGEASPGATGSTTPGNHGEKA